MALVGEAHILVRAITTNVSSDIRRGFNGISGEVASKAGQTIGRAFSKGFSSSGSENIFGKISDGLQSISPGADAARQSFQRLVRGGYVAQGAFGLLLGGISALIGGLGALVGAAGGAAIGLVALGGAAVALKVGFSIAGLALKGISQAVSAATKANSGYSKSLKEMQFDAEDATLGVEKAGIALEKAIEARNRVADLAPNNRIRREADLAVRQAELALRKAKYEEENPKKNGAAGTDPYADLTPSQKQFAKFLAGIQPQLEEIKEAVAKGFLPLLEQQMRRLIDAGVLDIIKIRFYEIAEGMGLAAKKFTDVFLSGNVLKNFDSVLGGIADLLPQFGTVVGNYFGGFLSILKAAIVPLESLKSATQLFVDYLEKKSTAFKDFFDAEEQSGRLARVFIKGEKILERFLGIFGNVFKSIKNIIAANMGPGSGGQIMVMWLEKVTKGWANLGLTVDGKVSKPFKDFFTGAATNTTKILDAVGALVKEFLKLGDMPEIGQAFDILKEGAPAMGEMFRAAVRTGPAFSKLLVEVTKIFAAIADSDAPNAFFDTLTVFATAIRKVLENETVRDITLLIGKVLAIGLAFGTVGKTAMFFGKILVGAGAAMFGTINKIITGIGSIQTFFLRLTMAPGAFLQSLGKIGMVVSKLPVIGWIVTIIAMMVELYNRSEDFRTIVSNTFKTIGESLAGLWGALKGLFDQLFGGEGLGGVMTTMQPLTDWILGGFVPALGGAIATVIDIVKVAIGLLTSLIGGIMNGIKPIISGIMDIFALKFGPGLAKIFGGIGIVLIGIMEGIVNTIIAGINIVLRIITQLVKSIGTGPIGQFLKTISSGKLDLTKVDLQVDYVKWSAQASKNLMGSAGKAIPATTKLAEGGIVYPRSGGSMVTVAEAGRPERVEPLHPNGLSDRDIAIINKLSNAAGQPVNISVYPSAKMDEKELAAEVSRQIAFNIRKGGY